MPPRDVTPKEALEALRQEPALRILDVRTGPEYQSHHLEDAYLLPIEELQQRHGELNPNESWLVTCEHGVRSVAACEFLASLGFRDLRNLQGGMAQWLAEALPLDPRQQE